MLATAYLTAGNSVQTYYRLPPKSAARDASRENKNHFSNVLWHIWNGAAVDMKRVMTFHWL